MVVTNNSINSAVTQGMHSEIVAGYYTLSNLRNAAKYVVSSVAGEGGYTTVQAAITQAVSDGVSSGSEATIWIWPGTYTENLTLAPYVNLASAADPSAGAVVIVGNAVYPDPETGNLSISNVGFQTSNSSAALSFQSSGSSTIHLQSVAINGATGIGLECTGSGMTIQCSIGSISADTGGRCKNITDGFVEFFSSLSQNTDTASTISGGALRVVSGDIQDAFAVTGAGFFQALGCVIQGGGLDCVNLDTGTVAFIGNCVMASSAGFIVGGTGTVFYDSITALQAGNSIQNTVNQQILGHLSGAISFDGGTTYMDTDGQVWIGSSSGVPVPATLTAGTGVTITNAANSITIAATGSAAAKYATYVVNPTPGLGDFTTIAAAVAAAVSGDTIFIYAGSYTENITLKAGITLSAYQADAANASGVTIIGNTQYSGAGAVTLNGITLQTNSNYALQVTGSSSSVITLNGGGVTATNNTGIQVTATGAIVGFNNCNCDVTTTGIALFDASSSSLTTTLFFSYCNLYNSGISTTASSASCNVFFYFTYSNVPLTGNNAGVNFYSGFWDTVASNVSNVSVNATNLNIGNSTIYCGTSTPIVSTSGNGAVANCVIIGGSTYSIDVTGTLFTENNSYSNPTQRGTNASAAIGIVGVTPVAGSIGETISDFQSGVSLTTATDTTVASITLTPGTWDISALAVSTIGAGGSTEISMGISTTTNSLGGTVEGDTLVRVEQVVGKNSLVIPVYRQTITTNTNYYMVVNAVFGVSVSVSGRITAVRSG